MKPCQSGAELSQRKIIRHLAACLCILLTTILHAADGGVTENAPAPAIGGLVADAEAVDLGTVEGLPPGEDSFVAKFILRNPGALPVRITRVRTSCGCTSHELSQETVGPGEECVLTVRLSTAQHVGHRRRTFFVETDAPQSPVIVLRLSGTFPDLGPGGLELQPSAWRLPPRLGPGLHIQTTFVLRNNDKKRQIKLNKVEVPDGLQVLTRLPARIRPEQELEIIIALTADADPETISGSIRFHTDHPTVKELHAEVRPPEPLIPLLNASPAAVGKEPGSAVSTAIIPFPATRLLQLLPLLEGQERLALLDVREPEAFIAAHIPHSANLPASAWPTAAGRWPRSAVLLIIAADNQAAMQAAAAFQPWGQRALLYLDGGMASWLNLPEAPLAKSATAARP